MHVCANLREKRESQTVAFLSITLPINSRSNTTSSSRPKSWLIETITEEPSNLELWPFFTGSDSSELLKRHHRPRASLPRSNSAPLLLSTTTTSPIHINSTYAFILLASLSSTDYPTIATCLPLSCPVVTPTTPASAAQVTSTSRRRPPALPQSRCATRSADSWPPSRIRRPKK